MREPDQRAVGLGLRRALFQDLLDAPVGAIDFVECAPENWIGLGGRYASMLSQITARYPLTCHGLSLDLGGLTPFDDAHLNDLRTFLREHQVQLYSEHLSWSGDNARLHELFPLPFSDESVRHVSARIRDVQDRLERRIAIENVSYYLTMPTGAASPMSEPEFVHAVAETADCDVLLDVNNLYVNHRNHGTDPLELLHLLDPRRIVCMHIAGHFVESNDLVIDSHGAAVTDTVWDLLDQTVAQIGPRATVLERDFHFPPFEQLLDEAQRIRLTLQRTMSSTQ